MNLQNKKHDNTMSGSDSAKEDICFEYQKPVCHTPSSDDVFDEIKPGFDMTVVPTASVLFILFSLPLVAWLLGFRPGFMSGLGLGFGYDHDFWYCIITFACGLWMLIIAFTRKTTVHSDYIKIPGSAQVPWDSIVKVDYAGGRVSTFCFMYDNTKTRDSGGVLINSHQTNFRECLENAFKILPRDVFTKAAMNKLAKMGIWGW